MNIPAANPTGSSRDAYVARHYRFTTIQGLSRKGLDLHIELYNGYVKQVNALQLQIEQLPRQRKLNELERLRRAGLVQRCAFELNGMLLHELFFEQLNGHPSGPAPSPGSVLMEAMAISFGGLDCWRDDIYQLAETRGAGWVVTARHNSGEQLSNFWIAEHHVGVPIGVQPIAVFDLWEHAYLLDFAPSARRDYLSVLFRNIDWSVLERRCVR